MVELVSLENLISEVASQPYFKDNPHLIDKAAIYRWVTMALGNFGRNIMQKQEAVIHIQNYKGLKPKGFKQLSLAIKLDLAGINVNTEDKSVMQGSFMWKERIEKYNLEDTVDFNCEETCEKKTYEKTIVENFYLRPDVLATARYINPLYLKIGDDLLGSCDSDCVNRFNYDSRFQINIKGDFVNANFKNGVIYLRYWGLPIDDDGLPLIPDTENHSVQHYLEYLIKRKLLEQAMWSKDAVNLQAMFQFTVQEEKNLLTTALRDTSPLSMKALWNAIDFKRKNVSKFNVNLGNY
jgi:hypothetical protein